MDTCKEVACPNRASFGVHSLCLKEAPSSVVVAREDDYDPVVNMRNTASRQWEMDIQVLISTKKWLQNYGLQRNNLSISHILSAIGFKMSEDFDLSLKRPVASKYAEGVFKRLMRADGKMFNIACGYSKLHQLESHLQQSISLFKRRMEWLTTESRRIFGVIDEKCITIVLDIRNTSPKQFDLYRMGLEQVLHEQVSKIKQFNLIRADDDITQYREQCVLVTHDTLANAITWLWNLDCIVSVSPTVCVEAMLKAVGNTQNEAVYLYTEGSSVNICRQLLREKICNIQHRPVINVVSYNCEDSDTARFLREFAKAVGGKYHIYTVIMEIDSFESLPVDQQTNKANIVLKKKTFSGIPPGAGLREDVMLLFQELEEAHCSLVQIQRLIKLNQEPKMTRVLELAPILDIGKVNEQSMSSRQWLNKFGLAANKLELFDMLGDVAFHHRDGVVELQKQPLDEFQTDALYFKKLVNAKYCEKFPVVRWRDGNIMHVQVTPELHRAYEQKMLSTLKAIQKRIVWLNLGSRALFGTLIENQIYILIDTSKSMVPSIQYVKDKLYVLLQEQLRGISKFNLIAFNTKPTMWQKRLIEVTDAVLDSARHWIHGLTCFGSTNTFAAIQCALSDPGIQAMYLLTDGRPDQPHKTIIAQVQGQGCVPVHTISFNCNDTEANEFLFDLAHASGGRYHYFTLNGVDPEGQPASFESEDIVLLKRELHRGLSMLEKVAELRDECANLSWTMEMEEMKKCIKSQSRKFLNSSKPAMEQQEMYHSNTHAPTAYTSSAHLNRQFVSTPMPKVTTYVKTNSSAIHTRRQKSARPTSTKGSIRPQAAGHTRTSLMHTLNAGGSFSSKEWLLPETKHLFEVQASKRKRFAEEYLTYQPSNGYRSMA